MGGLFEEGGFGGIMPETVSELKKIPGKETLQFDHQFSLRLWLYFIGGARVGSEIRASAALVLVVAQTGRRRPNDLSGKRKRVQQA